MLYDHKACAYDLVQVKCSVCGQIQCTYSECGRRQGWSGRVTVRWVITCAFGADWAQGGAALGWTAASPIGEITVSHQHMIREERRREEPRGGEHRFVCMWEFGSVGRWGCAPIPAGGVGLCPWDKISMHAEIHTLTHIAHTNIPRQTFKVHTHVTNLTIGKKYWKSQYCYGFAANMQL